MYHYISFCATDMAAAAANNNDDESMTIHTLEKYHHQQPLSAHQ